MRRRAVLGGLAAALSGLAGCATGDDRSGEPTPDPGADWTDGDGLAVDPLEDSHVEALTDAGSFAVRSVADTGHSGDERPSSWLFSQTLESRVDAGSQRRAFVQDLTEVGETTTVYVADDRAYYRVEAGDGVRYDVRTVDGSAGTFLEAMGREARTGVRGLGEWPLAYDEPVDLDGRRAFRYVADEYAGARDVPAEIDAASAAALVEERGVVRRIEQSFAGTHEGQDAEVDVTISHEGVGETTVAEPDWLAEARERADE